MSGAVSISDASGRNQLALNAAGIITPISSLLFESFDSATLDTTNKWTTLGTAPTATGGQLTFNQGTTALAFSGFVSQPAFQLLGNMFVVALGIVKVDSLLTTGSYRFEGIGNAQGSPTVAAPIVDGIGFEWDATTGVLSGVEWSAGVRTRFVSLAASQPTDGGFHRYQIYFKTSRAIFEIDNVQVGFISYPAPSTSNLPKLSLVVNGAATVNPASVFISTFYSIGDSAGNNAAISDPTYPWRRSAVGVDGGLNIAPSPGKQSYSASATGVAGVVGDTFTIFGSATKTVRVTRLELSGIATAAADLDVQLIKRSAVDTGGTATAVTATPHDSANAAATATLNFYTVAPTPGAAVGTPVRSVKGFATTATAAPVVQSWDFGNGPKQGIVLRGVAQGLCLSLSAALTGGSFDIDIEWTEE